MKAKTLLELLTYSSTLYALSKDKELMDKLKEMAEKGRDRVNKAMSEPKLDEDGNEMEFIDRLIHKAGQAKEELEDKIKEIVADFYKNVNIAHTDEIRGLQEHLREAEKSIALLEARLNHLESKEEASE